MSASSSARGRVCVVGAGAAGLVTACVLLQDAFDVQIITQDATVGGVWARERVFQGLQINNVHGEYKFSFLPMKPAENDKTLGQQLRGNDMCEYMEAIAEKYLVNKIEFNTRVLNIRRAGQVETGWIITVHPVKNAAEIHERRFDKVVVCTGGASNPFIPQSLSSEAALEAGFNAPVIHSSELGSRCASLIEKVPRSSGENKVLIIGGGKSARDAATYICRFHPKLEDIRVKMVFENGDPFLATKSPLPDCLRLSRFLAVLAGYPHLRSRLEQFFHLTRFGSWLNHFIWRTMYAQSYAAMHISEDSPLRRTEPGWWSVRNNDEGVPSPTNFFSFLNQGKIQLVAPRRVVGYSKGKGNAVLLDNGEEIGGVGLVILCTGYQSSWKDTFDDKTASELGIRRQPPTDESLRLSETQWRDFCSLANPPPLKVPYHEHQSCAMYRGMVPVKNILNRDFAVNGAVFSTNNGYTFEVMSHWISSYFLQDSFLNVPSSIDDAIKVTDRDAAWMRKRYPYALVGTNESYTGLIVLFSYAQYCDDLLEDMGLPITRSGGNWLTWAFKPIKVEEIAELVQERKAKRFGNPDYTYLIWSNVQSLTESEIGRCIHKHHLA